MVGSIRSSCFQVSVSHRQHTPHTLWHPLRLKHLLIHTKHHTTHSTQSTESMSRRTQDTTRRKNREQCMNESLIILKKYDTTYLRIKDTSYTVRILYDNFAILGGATFLRLFDTLGEKTPLYGCQKVVRRRYTDAFFQKRRPTTVIRIPLVYHHDKNSRLCAAAWHTHEVRGYPLSIYYMVQDDKQYTRSDSWGYMILHLI